MDAVCWSDYLCPWCYVAQDRTALLRSLGVKVVVLPFELHPRIPLEGVSRPPKAERWTVVAAEAEDAGLEFVPPARWPNTRRLLELSEWVRRTQPDAAFEAFHASVFAAYFGKGLAVDSAEVLDPLLAEAGVDGAEAWAAVDGGEPSRWVDGSMALAQEVGVAGTPAWLLGGDGGLLVPGVQPRSFFERVVTKLQR